MTYARFFATAFGGSAKPFDYQRALAESKWPDALIAPTGLGKTAAVVLAWLWRRATAPGTTPRRLVYCLPMRTLADQTDRNATAWLGRLARVRADWEAHLPRPECDVHLLMGGEDEPRWYEQPDRPAILIGTQDMLISRALMRGYAMSRFRWPVDFALLHNDAQWVFDEVQLMSSGLATSTQLEGFRRRFGTGIGAASLWISATLHPEWLRTVDAPDNPTVWRVPDDFPEDRDSPVVRRLLDAPKLIAPSRVRPASARKADLSAYVRELAGESSRPVISRVRMTLVILNTVARAQQVHAALVRQGAPSDRLALVHSRFRLADRTAQMNKLPQPHAADDLIVVTTQAIEAGVDLSAATLVTELAPASSLVQRFGRVNRYGELNDSGGATIRWVDLADIDDTLAAPYELRELTTGRARIAELSDARPAHLPPPAPEDCSHRWVIRSKDLIDLYDTDPDLTGFDVDVSPYVRDAEDTDVQVFWRDFDRSEGPVGQPPPQREELCSVPIGQARDWLKKVREKHRLRPYHADPQARRRGATPRQAAWVPLDSPPWPGLVLLLHVSAGGYSSATGFSPAEAAPVVPVGGAEGDARAAESLDSDPGSEQPAVPLTAHLGHVVAEGERLCDALGIADDKAEVAHAACWHDVGKSHPSFQERLGVSASDPLLAKAPHYDVTRGRPYFRHELASALAYLSHAGWARAADLVAYLIAAHHGKVRMNLRALPAESPATSADGNPDARRFARGVWEGDELPAVELAAGEKWNGGALTLSVMELGDDARTGASWTERTHSLLERYGPFRLALLEALLRVADWRASATEEANGYDC